MKCKQCGKKTENPKFCSRSCSATFNNLLRGDRSYSEICPQCGGEKFRTSKLCRNCYLRNIKLASITDDKLISELVYRDDANRYNHIRGRARTAHEIFFGKNPKCFNCGYSKHVHICHKKPISDFDESTPVSVVNSKRNLVALCPNCHWEFDRGLLRL